MILTINAVNAANENYNILSERTIFGVKDDIYDCFKKDGRKV